MAAPPILHILKVLAEEGPELGLTRLRAPSDAELGPLRRIEFRPGVIMFPLATPTLPPATHTNAYLVGASKAVLIDPGSGYEAELQRLKLALDAARDILRKEITAIWLTHHHADHIGGVAAMREYLNVPVLAHRLTGERLREYGLAIDGELSDGQRVELGGDPPFVVRVIHTPGHARGHLCFYDERMGSLIAGDMVAGTGTIVIDPPEGDMQDYLDSLARLRDLKPHTLFPSHGPAVKNAVEKLQEYIDHRLWREDKILAAWNSGKHAAAEIVPLTYDDVPEAAWPLAARQVEAHLARLRKLGKI